MSASGSVNNGAVFPGFSMRFPSVKVDRRRTFYFLCAVYFMRHFTPHASKAPTFAGAGRRTLPEKDMREATCYRKIR